MNDVEPGLGELKAQTRAAIEPLLHPTNDWVHKWGGGSYFSIFARPSKRLRAILDVEREILVAGNVYYEQQVRSLAYAKHQIDGSNGRLEPNLCIIVHCDPKGNSKLKKWGRQQGLAVLPIYARNGNLPAGADFERALSFELFSQDPFDVTGPVASDAQFFGRRTEAQELARKLQTGQIRAHLGIRKIGKTSIMHRVLREVEENYSCNTIFIDCQNDAVFNSSAANLLHSVSEMIRQFDPEGPGEVYEIEVKTGVENMAQASRQFAESMLLLKAPCIIAFDEVDYITPGSPTADHWRREFVDFWRNIRAGYQAANRAGLKLSVLVCGVSSKWFSVESIDGVENAALSFVPEEYLSPLPRGAAIAMIKNVGAMAGLQFEEAAANTISAACSDMPFWIRKACSYIHGRTDTAARPLTLSEEAVRPSLSHFVDNEGAGMAMVALQHLFRVYPELKATALAILQGDREQQAAGPFRVLRQYGLISASGEISGAMISAGLKSLVDAAAPDPLMRQGEVAAQSVTLGLSDWIEEIQIISRRRNLIEKRLREIAFNFLRYVSLSDKAKNAKDIVLASLESRRRDEVAGYKFEEIADRIYWKELVNIVARNWTVFEPVFNDKRVLQENAELINERPDAHAKTIDLADVALYRRALDWFEGCLEKI
jgi:hypothetical protein